MYFTNRKVINLYVGCYDIPQSLDEDIKYLNQMNNNISINFIIAIRPCYKKNNDYLKHFVNYQYFDFDIKRIVPDIKSYIIKDDNVKLPIYQKYSTEKKLDLDDLDYDYIYTLMLGDNYFSLLDDKIGFKEENKNNLLLLMLIMSIGYLNKKQIEIVCSIVNNKDNISLYELRNRYEFIWDIKDRVFSGSIWGDFVIYARQYNQLKEQLDIFFCMLLFRIVNHNDTGKSTMNISDLRSFIHSEYDFILNPQFGDTFKLLIEFCISYEKHQTIVSEDVEKLPQDSFIEYLNEYKLTICAISLKLVLYLAEETQNLNLIYTYLIELRYKLFDLNIDSELSISICEFLKFSIENANRWSDITIMEEAFIVWDMLLKNHIIEQNAIIDFQCKSSNLKRETIFKIIINNSLNELEKHIIGVDTMQVDVLIIIATQEEEEAIVNNDDWEECEELKYTYFYKYEDGIAFALVRGIQYGKTDAAIVSGYFIPRLKPKAVAMAGFAAGQKGKINLGDIIVPHKVYDYDGGKQIEKNKCLKELDDFRIKDAWKQIVERFGENWRESVIVERPKDFEQQYIELLQEFNDENKVIAVDDIYNTDKYPDWKKVVDYLVKSQYINLGIRKQIKIENKGTEYINMFNILHPNGYKVIEPKTKVGILATGSKVEDYPKIFEELAEYDRKTYALEMEASAIAKTAHFLELPYIIAKGIGDFAGEGDGSGLGKEFQNRYIEYACHSSCRFIIEFFISDSVKQTFDKNKI